MVALPVITSITCACAPANMSGINEMTAAAACSAGSRRVKAPT